LQNLFDGVHIEVLLNNVRSLQFQPNTGVLQSSILSPFLYSLYINDLPKLLRLSQLEEPQTPIKLARLMRCLLYADDVVLIAEQSQMNNLLIWCEERSLARRYRRNPSKDVILDSNSNSYNYSLYGNPIPGQTYFPYLSVPFNPGGLLNAQKLIHNNFTKALNILHSMPSIGVNAFGLSRLLFTIFYANIIAYNWNTAWQLTASLSPNLRYLKMLRTNAYEKSMAAILVVLPN
jgi:hypothetical protein